MKATLIASVLAVAAWAAPARADVPHTMTFAARLTDGETALAGPHTLVFRLYDAETGGNPRWTESHASVPVEQGRVTVALGSSAPLTPSVLDDGPLWIEIVLDGEVMTPRLPLRSVPYAGRAGDATLLAGQPPTAFAPTVHQHDAAYVNAAGDSMTGSLNLGADLMMGGKLGLRGSDTWLRLNQDGAFTSGTHTPKNFNAGGVTVGTLFFDPGAGNLEVEGTSWLRGGGRLNGIAVGSAPFGAVSFPYETIQLDPSFNLRFAFGANERMRLNSDGSLVMGTARTDCPSGWFCNGMFWDLSVSSILYSGLSQRSDARLKQNIEPLQHGLDTVRALRPVTFQWRDPATPGRQHGLIAQEVQQVVPSLVTSSPDGMLAVDMQEMLPILMQAVKELDAANTELRAELASLRAARPATGAMPRPGDEGGGASTLAMLVAFVALPVLAWIWSSRGRRG